LPFKKSNRNSSKKRKVEADKQKLLSGQQLFSPVKPSTRRGSNSTSKKAKRGSEKKDLTTPRDKLVSSAKKAQIEDFVNK
jgi:hypothetical protein